MLWIPGKLRDLCRIGLGSAEKHLFTGSFESANPSVSIWYVPQRLFINPAKKGNTQVYLTGEGKEQKEISKICNLPWLLECCVRSECKSVAEDVKGEGCGHMQPFHTL